VSEKSIQITRYSPSNLYNRYYDVLAFRLHILKRVGADKTMSYHSIVVKTFLCHLRLLS